MYLYYMSFAIKPQILWPVDTKDMFYCCEWFLKLTALLFLMSHFYFFLIFFEIKFYRQCLKRKCHTATQPTVTWKFLLTLKIKKCRRCTLIGCKGNGNKENVLNFDIRAYPEINFKEMDVCFGLSYTFMIFVSWKSCQWVAQVAMTLLIECSKSMVKFRISFSYKVRPTLVWSKTK